MDTSRTTSYTDLSGLNQLKQLGKKDNVAAIHKVAQQFESMFVSQLLKNMREGNKVFNQDDPLNSSEVEFHQEMYDQQLSLSLSSNGHGIGLASVLERQLGAQYHIGQKPADVSGKPGDKNNLQENSFTINRNEQSSKPLIPISNESASKILPLETEKPAPVFKIKMDASKAAGSATEKPADKKVTFDSPEQFIKALYQHAKDAASQLGVKTEFLLSQAALETGWGKHLMQDKDGNSSHNLFGIKAGDAGAKKPWSGDVVNVASLEHENGVMKPVVSSFRAYDSFKASFDDYVAFLKNNPRYQQALAVAGDAKAFAQKLQDAGYATDPDYAAKVIKILSSDSFKP